MTSTRRTRALRGLLVVWAAAALVTVSGCGGAITAGSAEVPSAPDGQAASTSAPGEVAQAATQRPCPTPTPVAEGGPTVIIDWIDALQFAGGSFSANGATTSRAELGPQVGNVQCRIGDVVNDPSYELQDGDAIRWPPGTPIFSVAGYPSSCRLAVTEGATVWVYELSDPSASVATAAPCPRAN